MFFTEVSCIARLAAPAPPLKYFSLTFKEAFILSFFFLMLHTLDSGTPIHHFHNFTGSSSIFNHFDYLLFSSTLHCFLGLPRINSLGFVAFLPCLLSGPPPPSRPPLGGNPEVDAMITWLENAALGRRKTTMKQVLLFVVVEWRGKKTITYEYRHAPSQYCQHFTWQRCSPLARSALDHQTSLPVHSSSV